jgi:hypothetical protein
MSKFKKTDLSKVRTIKVSERKTKAEITRFGKLCDPDTSISDFMQSLPDYLKARDLLQVAEGIAKARLQNSALIWMMGAHPIKVGLSDIIVDLAENKFISHIALNGAGVIHDIEMAFFGRTSEEVADGLADGSFGMVEETPALIFEAAKLALNSNLGFGEGVGKFISDKAPEYADHSILCQMYKLGIPVSVHVAIGTDTICQHPGFDGAVFGKLSHDDFRLLCESVITLGGGAVINIGSAVILPEVFLKALTVSRNIHSKPQNFTAINFDMIQHYRPNTNVVNRPTAQNGRGFSFTGHHEIMIPLLAVAIKDKYRELTGKV